MYVYTFEEFGSLRFTECTNQSRFTEQFFSTSQFTNTKNGRSLLHENKLGHVALL